MDYFDQELAEIQQLIQQNKLSDAVKLYTELLNKVSEEDEILLHVITKDLGYLYYEMEHYEHAIEFLLTALNQNFDDEDGRTNKILGFSYSKLNQYEYAVEYLEEAIFQCSEEHEQMIIRFELGKVYIEISEPELAIQQLKLAYNFFSTDEKNGYFGSTTYYLGFAYYLIEDLELANEYFNSLTENTSLEKTHLAHGYYGKLFVAKSRKNAEEMILFAGKLMELIPDFYDRETIMFFTVLAYQYQNRMQEYDKALEFFIAEYPNGKYAEKYEDLKNYEFKTIEI